MDSNTKKQVQQNAEDIKNINQTLVRLETNHIFHIEKDMEKQSRMIEKLDMRLWWVLGLLVVGIVIPAFISGLMGG